MKPGFLEASLYAALLACAAAILHQVLTPVFGNAAVLGVLCAGVSFSYVLYLLVRSGVRRGRVTLLAGWALAAFAIAALSPSLLVTVVGHLALIWVVRVVTSYASVLAALIDLGISGFSLAAAAWALAQTHSLFATVWCLLLVQALATFIPAQLRGITGAAPPSASDLHARFQRAEQAAAAALATLAPRP